MSFEEANQKVETNWEVEMQPIMESIDLFMGINKLVAHDIIPENIDGLLESDLIKGTDSGFLVTGQYNHPLSEEMIELFFRFSKRFTK